MAYIIKTLDGMRLDAAYTRDKLKEALYRLGLEPFGAKIGQLPRFGRSNVLVQPKCSPYQSYVISHE